MSYTFINQDNIDKQVSSNDPLKESGIRSDFISSQQYARELKVKKFKKKKAKIMDNQNQLSNLSQSEVTSVSSDKRINPFEKFQQKLMEEYQKLGEDLKKEQTSPQKISQSKIQLYLQNYWYHKIYRKNQNQNQNDSSRTNYKQMDSDQEWKKLGSNLIHILHIINQEQMVQSRPFDNTSKFTSVIKGKVYLIKKAQLPQKNVQEEEEKQEMAKRLVRKSIFIKQFHDEDEIQVNQNNSTKKRRFSSVHIFNLKNQPNFNLKALEQYLIQSKNEQFPSPKTIQNKRSNTLSSAKNGARRNVFTSPAMSRKQKKIIDQRNKFSDGKINTTEPRRKEKSYNMNIFDNFMQNCYSYVQDEKKNQNKMIKGFREIISDFENIQSPLKSQMQKKLTTHELLRKCDNSAYLNDSDQEDSKQVIEFNPLMPFENIEIQKNEFLEREEKRHDRLLKKIISEQPKILISKG